MGVSLRTLLLVPVVLQVVGITSLIGYFSYRAGQQTVESLAEQLIVETSERITHRLGDYFGNAEHLVQENQLAIELEILNWQDSDLVKSYFLKQLRLHPSMVSLSLAIEGQQYLAVTQISPGQWSVHQLDKEARMFESRVVDQHGTTTQNQDIASGLDFRNHATRRGDDIAPASAAGAWLPVAKPGRQGEVELLITRLEPFRDAQGQRQGVLGAAFRLDQISAFLNELELGKSGQIFLIDRQGHVVATSTPEVPLRQHPVEPGQPLDPDRWLLPARESQNPVTQAAALWAQALPAAERAGKPDQTYFQVEGHRYFGYRLALALADDQPQWTMVMAVPTTAFKAAIYQNNQRTILLCVAGLLGSVSLGLWLVRYLTRPLEQLDQTIQRYASEGKFQPPPATGVRDLDSLGQTLGQMVTHLDAQQRQITQLHASYAQSLQAQVSDKTRELQAITARLQESQHIARVGSWEMDVATGVIEFSESLLELLQLSPSGERLQYPQLLEMVHADDRSRVQAAVELGIQSGQVEATEIRILQSGGQIQYVVSRGKAVYDDGGQVVKLVGTITDITDRKQMEIALQDSNSRLRQALEISRAVVWEHDLQTHNIFFSSTTTQTEPYSMTYEDALAKVHPDDQPRVRQANEDVVATLGSYNLEHRVVDPDATSGWRWFQVNARVMTDGANQPTKILGMSVDVSDRKRAELALRESEAHFATIFRDNPAPAWITTLADGLVLDVNRSFCAFVGLPAAAIVGQTCIDLQLWDNPDDCHQLRQILTQHGMHRNYQTTWRIGTNETRTVLLSTKVVTFRGEACVIGVVNDITDRQETENMLRKLSQQLLTWRDRYEVAIWAGRQIIYEYDALTDCYTWGRNTQDILGYDLEEMPQTLEEYVGFIHPTEQQAFLDVMTGGVDVSEPFKLEFRVLHQGGGYTWLEDQGVPQLDDQGQLVKVVGALKDISDRKQAEAERAHMIALLKQSEANYLGILQHQTELVTRFTADGILLFVNAAFCTYYGVSWEDVVGRRYYPNIYPEDQPAIDRCLASLSAQHPVGTVQHRVFVKGEIRWMEWTNKAIYDAGGNFVELQSVGRDIHDRRQTELALQQSRAKFQRLVDDIGDKFVVFSSNGNDGLITYVSDGIETVFGLTKAQVVGQRWDQVVNWQPEDVVLAEGTLEIMQSQQLDFYQYEMRFIHPDQDLRTAAVSQHLVKDQAGQLVAIEGIVEDITDRKRSEQELQNLNARLQALNARLEELATQDSLTRLANRRKMEQVLQLEWYRCQRETQPLALILLDIDYFKAYNDHYGHPQGDWCLRQVADVLQASMKRPGDLVARYGGEEFLLILPNTDVQGAITIARHIQTDLANLKITHAHSAVSEKVTVSLGLAVVNCITPDLSCSEAVALADKALYQAKQVRNTFHVEVMS